MPRKRHTAEQIISKLREAEVGLASGHTVPEVCRTLGIAEQTYYRWRKEYGGLKVGHPSQDFDVRIGRQKLRLEPPHLAGGRSLSFDGLATNNPPHGRITSETVGVVYVLITTKATKHRLTELPRHAVPSVLAGTAVLENSPGNLGQAKGIIKLPIGQQPAVRGDLGPVKFQLQAAVEIDPKSVPFRFTHRMCHLLCPLSPLSI